jgi:hypothetical protein
VPGHVHTQTDETHALTTQARAMAREGRKPVRTHDSMARYLGVVAPAHDIPHGAPGQGTTGEHSDESVGRDATGRNASHHRMNGFWP